MPLLASDGLRRVFSALGGGVLLVGGLGVQDPCEKEDADAFHTLTEQGKWDIVLIDCLLTIYKPLNKTEKI